jgi:hypothetical protein
MGVSVLVQIKSAEGQNHKGVGCPSCAYLLEGGLPRNKRRFGCAAPIVPSVLVDAGPVTRVTLLCKAKRESVPWDGLVHDDLKVVAEAR